MASNAPNARPGRRALTLPRSAGLLRNNSDLPLALGVVTIIGLLVFQVPPWMMDYFLAANISVSLTILLVALYVSNALRIPSFPTILLLATLFRLALNVGTTRLILLEANAGSIIRSFGDFVVGGNFVVGAVVFLVLVIVQFVVIAKGSERVAEVAARFTLDAMPGKQMSIDADLRGGLIDPEGAKTRRGELERESKLYGAMDGAMKFVKGDAIAGIIISIVNIVGGLVVGVAQQGMDFVEAAQVYSLLTIGDGLVSQIPALLISVSAGLVVTRVAASDSPDGANLGRELLEQITANPKGLFVAASILVSSAILSVVFRVGFAPLPFLLIGGVLFALGFMGIHEQQHAKQRGQSSFAGREPQEQEEKKRKLPSYAPPPLVLNVHPILKPLFAADNVQQRRQQKEFLASQREQRNQEVGIPYPALSVGVDGKGLEPYEYVLIAHGSVIARGRVSPTQFYAMARPATMAKAEIQVVPAFLPGTRHQVSLIGAEEVERIQNDPHLSRIKIKRPDIAVFEHVHRVLQQRARLFFGIQEAQDLVDALEQRSQALVHAVMPRLLTVQPLTEVLGMLLEEQVPIRDLRGIFESLARYAEKHPKPEVLVKLVRRDLGPALCSLYSGGVSKLRYYGLSDEVEDLLTGKTITPANRKLIIQLAAKIIPPGKPGDAPPVIMVSNPDVRRRLWWVLKEQLPEIRVLTRDETVGQEAEAIDYVKLEEVSLAEKGA